MNQLNRTNRINRMMRLYVVQGQATNAGASAPRKQRVAAPPVGDVEFSAWALNRSTVLATALASFAAVCFVAVAF